MNEHVARVSTPKAQLFEQNQMAILVTGGAGYIGYDNPPA
jgi:hypothetical protein